MTALSELTDEQLKAEYDAAHYFADGSYDPDEIKRAEARIDECEKEFDRRDAQRKSI